MPSGASSQPAVDKARQLLHRRFKVGCSSSSLQQRPSRMRLQRRHLLAEVPPRCVGHPSLFVAAALSMN
jgi:hypothetical protein